MSPPKVQSPKNKETYLTTMEQAPSPMIGEMAFTTHNSSPCLTKHSQHAFRASNDYGMSR
eukprot:6179786-Pleurochrysis_carterae.AAC.3